MPQYNWDWGLLFTHPYFQWLVSGLITTIEVSLLAWVVAFMLGSLIGISRTLPARALRAVGTVYVELFRNVPLLVQLFLWFFVVPEVLPNVWGHWLKRDLPAPEFWTAVVCLGTYTASRVAEQVRAGIQSVTRRQSQAALATGLTLAQTYRYIILPIAYRRIVPPLTTEFLTIFKNSSLGLTIGLLELTAQSRQIESYTFHPFEAYAAATVLYVLITALVMFFMRFVEAKSSVPGMFSRGRGWG